MTSKRLTDLFDCYGYFYKTIRNGRTIKNGRNILEIVTKDRSANGLLEEEPNAICFMMNPGKSKPHNARAVIPPVPINKFLIDPRKMRLVKTIPDNTQKRLMRIMQHQGWSHVRVLNVSDIRQYKSTELSREINEYNQFCKMDTHSIISNIRKTEFNYFVSNNEIPIILAWGTQDCLNPLIKKLLVQLKKNKCYGVKISSNALQFHHPLTRQLSWIEEMNEMIDKNEYLKL